MNLASILHSPVFLLFVIAFCANATFANLISSESRDQSTAAIQDESGSVNDSEEVIMAFGALLNQPLKPRSRIYFPGSVPAGQRRPKNSKTLLNIWKVHRRPGYNSKGPIRSSSPNRLMKPCPANMMIESLMDTIKEEMKHPQLISFPNEESKLDLEKATEDLPESNATVPLEWLENWLKANAKEAAASRVEGIGSTAKLISNNKVTLKVLLEEQARLSFQRVLDVLYEF